LIVVGKEAIFVFHPLQNCLKIRQNLEPQVYRCRKGSYFCIPSPSKLPKNRAKLFLGSKWLWGSFSVWLLIP
jgi:hypothetical protein